MNTTLRNRLAATGVAAVSALALACGGAVAAHADTAPPTEVPNVGRVAFVVPAPTTPGAAYVSVEGDLFNKRTGNLAARDVSLYFGCNDERTYPISVTQTPTVDRHLLVDVALPLSEVGDLCYMTSTAVNGNTIAFGETFLSHIEGDSADVAFAGEPVTVVPSRRGGQY